MEGVLSVRVFCGVGVVHVHACSNLLCNKHITGRDIPLTLLKLFESIRNE